METKVWLLLGAPIFLHNVLVLCSKKWMKANGRAVMLEGSACAAGTSLPAPWRARVRDLCAVPASFQHLSAPCCPLAGQQHDAGLLEGVRGVTDPGVGKGRRLFAGAAQLVTPAAANTGSLSASCPAKHKPSCCCASRSQQRPRSRFECCCRLGPKAIVNRAVNGPFVRGAKAEDCDMKAVAPLHAAGDEKRCGFVTSVPTAA